MVVDIVKKYVLEFIVAFFSVISGYAMYQKRKADKLEKRNKEMADEIVQSEYNHSVDIANELNKKTKLEEVKDVEVPTSSYDPSKF